HARGRGATRLDAGRVGTRGCSRSRRLAARRAVEAVQLRSARRSPVMTRHFRHPPVAYPDGQLRLVTSRVEGRAGARRIVQSGVLMFREVDEAKDALDLADRIAPEAA